MPEIGTEPRRRGEDGWAPLLRAAAAGHGDALAELYDAAAPLLYSLAVRILKNTADAEEVVGDVFAHIWSRGSSFDTDRGTAAAWLIMLTRSRCVDRLRNHAARRKAEEPIRQPTPPAHPNPLQGLEAERVRAALGKLPCEQRELLEEAYFNGRTQSELAEYLGIPLGTVKTRTRLALIRLRDHLSETTNPIRTQKT